MALSAERADAVLAGVIEISCCLKCGEMFEVSAKQRIRSKEGKLKSVPLCNQHMPAVGPGDSIKLSYVFEVVG